MTEFGRAEPGTVTMPRYRILGPIALHDEGEPVALGGPRQVALLAFLLVHRNTAVSTDQLLEALWRGAGGSGAKRVHVAMARLRKSLVGPSESPLRTLSGGYVLRIEPDELDADVFAAQLAAARAAAAANDHPGAVARLDQALALWRGPPLAEVGYEDFAQAEIRRLEELRLAAIEARADSALALGRHAQLVAELEPIAAAHPDRERLCGQLMLALYRCGRQVEALDAYQRTYRELVSALGLEPGPALKRLQQAILEQSDVLDLASAQDSSAGDPAAASPASRCGRAPLPPVLEALARLPFVGRAAARSRLSSCWDAAVAGRRSLAIVAGEPGIGKTAIAAQLANDVWQRDGDVLYGACETQPVVPYYPVVIALRAHFRHVPPPWRSGDWLDDVAAVLRLTPEARRSAPRPSSADDERYWLFEGVRHMLELLGERRPVLLIADDLQWAEPSTLMLLRHVAAEGDPTRLMLLAAYRDNEVVSDPAVRDTWAPARRSATEEIKLSGLGERETAEMIAIDAGVEVSWQVAERWHERTGGHPFFLRQLLRRADALAIERAHVAELPDGVRQLVSERVARLPQRVQGTLAVAAVIGREFDLTLLSSLLGQPVPVTLWALEQAIGSELVLEVPDRADRFAFAHALVRETLYEQQTRSRRVRLHADVADALERLAAPAAQRAHHCFEARHLIGCERAVAESRRAAAEAGASLAYEDAAEHLRRALAAVGEMPGPSDRRRCELLLELGVAEARAGQPSVDATFAEAAHIARRLGDAELLARAALAGRQSEPAYRDEARIARLSEALEALGDQRSTLRVEVLARFAYAAHFGDTGGHAAGASAEALQLASELGDPGALIVALHGRHAALMHIAHVEERTQLLQRLLRVAEGAGQRDFLALGHEWSIYARLELGQLELAQAELDRFAVVAGELRQPRFDHALLAWRAVFALLDGRLSDAERLAHDGHRLADRIQIADAEALFASQLCFIRRDQERLPEMAPVIAPYAAVARDHLWQAGLVLALEAAGDRASARSALETAAANSFEDVPRDFWWLSTIALFAEGCALVADACDATSLYRLLEPYAERHAQLVFAAHLGSVQRFLGLLAAAGGDERRARDHLEAAWERHAALGAPALALRSACELGALLMQTGAAQERRRGNALLNDAVAKASGKPLEAMITRLARAARTAGAEVMAGVIPR